MLLRAADAAAAQGLAERVQHVITALDAGVSVSFGIAEWPAEGPSKERLMRSASAALAASKRLPAGEQPDAGVSPRVDGTSKSRSSDTEPDQRWRRRSAPAAEVEVAKVEEAEVEAAEVEEAEVEAAEVEEAEVEVAKVEEAEVEAAELPTPEHRDGTEPAPEVPRPSLAEIEARAVEAETRATRTERLAALSSSLLERELQLRGVLTRIGEEEARTHAADARTRAAIRTAVGVDRRRPQPSVAAGAMDLAGINSASYEELRSAGLSAAHAIRLLTHRELIGGFGSLDELNLIPGLPDSLVEELARPAATHPTIR